MKKPPDANPDESGKGPVIPLIPIAPLAIMPCNFMLPSKDYDSEWGCFVPFADPEPGTDVRTGVYVYGFHCDSWEESPVEFVRRAIDASCYLRALVLRSFFENRDLLVGDILLPVCVYRSIFENVSQGEPAQIVDIAKPPPSE